MPSDSRREGARVASVKRTEANAQKTADEINAIRAGAAKAYAVDVSDHAAVQAAGAQIVEEFERVDVLVNNAGVTRDTLLMRMSTDDWDTVLNTNLKGAFNFIQAVQRTMIRQRSGRIITSARSSASSAMPARRTTPPARRD
jgi:3-oxoacyl-[acyl-carrier protein] reductase